MITQVIVTYHHKSVTVTLSHDHMSQGKTVKDSRRNNIIYVSRSLTVDFILFFLFLFFIFYFSFLFPF